MKSLLKYFAKKYILEIINDSLSMAKEKMDISSIKSRTKHVIAFCNLLLESLEDDKLSEEECDRIIDSATNLINR